MSGTFEGRLTNWPQIGQTRPGLVHIADHNRAEELLRIDTHYRRFIKKIVKLADPLHRIMKENDIFAWKEECEAEFVHLQSSLFLRPVLVLSHLK